MRFILPAILAAALSANAQLAPPNASGVSMGHLHFHSVNPDAHMKFWTEVLGGQPAKVGTLEVYKFPGVAIALTKAQPAGGMEGSTVPAVGFRVRDLAAILAKAKAGEVRVTEQTGSGALLIGPDDIRVRLTADPSLGEAVVNDRIELVSAAPAEMAKWYAEVFSASIPGVRLAFEKSATAAATKARVLDHIGFEVKDLQAFTKSLAARGFKVDLPYLKLPDLGIAIGFVTDPWGTYIELTEGLSRI